MFKVLLRDSSKGCLRGGTPSLWGFLNTIMTCYKYKACWSNSQNWREAQGSPVREEGRITVIRELRTSMLRCWLCWAAEHLNSDKLHKRCECHRPRWITKRPVAIKLVFAWLFGFATSKEVFFRKIIRFTGKSQHIKTTMQILMTYTVTVILL